MKTGQITLFIIIGLVIIIVVGSLIYALPRVFVPVAREPLPLELKRCIDIEFAQAIQEVALRGGKRVCDYDTVADLNGAEVCKGIRRMLPTLHDYTNVIIYSQNLFYGQAPFVRRESGLTDDIKVISEKEIRDNCDGLFRDVRNFNVLLTDTKTVLRFDMRRSDETNFERFQVEMDVPLKAMRNRMAVELGKSVSSYNNHDGEVFGLTHKFSDVIFPADKHLSAAYYSNITTQRNHLFYLETTNNPLPLPDPNVKYAAIIEDRFPVLHYPAGITCDHEDYINIIDPDEGQRDVATTYIFSPSDCNDDTDSADIHLTAGLNTIIYRVDLS